ncbi:AAA family ATPase [Agromyces arachidis]|uniref:AAA family ATPase n=1 Tax=Agromyces arachidis TaxID=766966 RepID=UPI00405605F7
MAAYVLVSRSSEYETRLLSLLGPRLETVAGEFLTFGADAALDRLSGTPRIALLGPVLNFEETRDLVRGLRERNPGVGLIVVREQRSDLEDWVDEMSVHAVLSPLASDETTANLLDRLADWLVTHGRAERSDFDAPPVEIEPEPEETAPDDEDESGAADVDAEEDEDDGTDADAEEDADGDADADADADAEPPAAEEEEEPEPEGPEWLFPPLDPSVRSEALAVVAPKGGQGKSTVSINLAAGLAEIAPNSVVLVDGDLQFGDITVALGLEPSRTIVEAVAPESVADELVLKTTLTHHPAGFFVVASAPSPELGDGIEPHALGALIERLRGIFRYVVVDTTPGLGEHTLNVLEHVTDAVFVSNMAVASLRAVRAELTLLTTLGLLPANRHMVLNFTDRMAGLTAKDAASIIGTPIDVEVPRSTAVVLASNRGKPLLHDNPRDPASKAIQELVARVAREDAPKRSRITRRRRILEPQ